ncbi:endonuclease/exonuclease/phosphatase family protein, partial [Pseudoxanthomonas sp. UTMC 1351]|uniref:endonuclease/exonuclease/phosphatase family protein n=1 Tax=Pseudoxanthomonas sp. UTMC 1351 TaxID=2695853 RepID=UPI0034CF2337
MPDATSITAQAPEQATSLSVVSLNLWHDKQDWPKRQNMILRELQALKPDAILLQEVLQDAALPNQAATLAQRLGYHYRFFSADPSQRARRYGNAILTRVSPQQVQEFKVLPLNDYRNVGWVRVEGASGPLSLYVTHLNHAPDGGAVRAQQVRSLLEFIGSTRGDAHSILAGDFNTRADAPELQPLTATFVDAYAVARPNEAVNAPEHTTLNTHLGHPPVRIDHVFFQKDAFRVTEARIILNRPDSDGAWPSDHYGVWV